MTIVIHHVHNNYSLLNFDPHDCIINIIMELEEYGEEDCRYLVGERELGYISRSCCPQWRALPSHLGLPSILVEDIERSVADEGVRRHIFFQEWKQRKGSEAIYEKLIGALLEINCRRDAENVCELLRDSTARARDAQPLAAQKPPFVSHSASSVRVLPTSTCSVHTM